VIPNCNLLFFLAFFSELHSGTWYMQVAEQDMFWWIKRTDFVRNFTHSSKLGSFSCFFAGTLKYGTCQPAPPPVPQKEAPHNSSFFDRNHQNPRPLFT
jgi:hypothetical protein